MSINLTVQQPHIRKPSQQRPDAAMATNGATQRLEPPVREGAPTVEHPASGDSVTRARPSGVEALAVHIPIGGDDRAGTALPAHVGSLTETSSQQLSTSIAALTDHVVTGGSPEPAIEAWKAFVGDANLRTGVDVNALVQWVLREAYRAANSDLQLYAEKVKFYNGLKKQLRDELTRARNVLSTTAGQSEDASLPQPFVPREINGDFVGAPSEGEGADGAGAAPDPDPEAERRAALQSEYDALNAEWESAAPKRTTYDGPQTKKEGGYGFGKYERDEVETIITTRANEASADLLDQFRNLTPEQKTALIEKLRTDGLDVSMSFREGNRVPILFALWNFDIYAHDRKPKLPAHLTSPEQVATWIADQVSEAAREVVIRMRADNSPFEGDVLEMSGWDVKLTLPGFTTSERPPLPDRMKELAAELALDTGSAAMPYASGEAPSTKAHLEAYIKETEERLASVGDDAQLANVDLQNMLQKQQQTLQMMSSIAKMLHDTAMAVIRKVGQ